MPASIPEPEVWAYVMLTAQEKTEWEQAAARSRMSLSNYIKTAVQLQLGPWYEYSYEREA